MEEIDIKYVNLHTSNKITLIERSGKRIGILDRHEILSGDDKVNIITNFFSSGEIFTAKKEVGLKISTDPDFNFTMVEVYKKTKEKINTYEL